MNVITEAEQFYGYLVGLKVEQNAEADLDGYFSPRLYAAFEYGSESSVWEVPELELFKILSMHLCSMAWARRENAEYGYEKLYIKKENGRWHVDLP